MIKIIASFKDSTTGKVDDKTIFVADDENVLEVAFNDPAIGSYIIPEQDTLRPIIMENVFFGTLVTPGAADLEEIGEFGKKEYDTAMDVITRNGTRVNLCIGDKVYDPQTCELIFGS